MRVNKRRFVVAIFIIAFLCVNSYFNLVIGILLTILFVLSTANILNQYIRTGRIAIFTGRNRLAINFLLIQGFGYYGYLARVGLGLANYNFNDDVIIKGLIIAIIGIIVFSIAYDATIKMSSNKSMLSFDFKIRSVYQTPTYKWVLLILAIIAGFAVFWKIMGGIPFFIADYSSATRTTVGKGLGYLEAFNISLVTLSLLLAITIIRKKQLNIYAGILLLIIIAIFILSSDRGGLMGYLMAVWFIYSLYRGQPTPKIFLKVFILMVVIAGVMGVLKRNDKSNLLLSGTIILTEVAVEYDNYNEIFNMVDNRGHLYGSTLVPIFTLPIPRSIMPNKDDYLTAGNYFKIYHNHNHIRVGERMGFLGEMYLNFGLLGCIVGMVVLGYILAILDKNVNLSSTLSVFIYIQLVNLFSGYAGDIATVFISFFMRNFLIILVLIFLCLIKANGNHIYRRLSA